MQLHGEENLEDIKNIKENFKLKVIKTIKIKKEKDVLNYKFYEKHADIILFDSAGFEKSQAFEHKWLEQIGKIAPPIMIAGKINEETNLESLQIDQNLIDRILKYASIKHILSKNLNDDEKILLLPPSLD